MPEDAAALATRVSRATSTAMLAVLVATLTLLPMLVHVTRSPWAEITDAFARAGALVFGGGHVVLPLLQAEPAIAELVSPEQFLAGYAAAQAVPGPLFTFAAYLGAEMQTGVLGIAAAAVALVAVFLPGILLLIAALPFWNALRNKPRMRSAMAGANAAEVGVLGAALVTPVSTSGLTSLTSLGIAILCFVVLTVRRWPAWAVVLIGAAIGAAAALAGAAAGLLGL